jgi:hypothetical protein
VLPDDARTGCGGALLAPAGEGAGEVRLVEGGADVVAHPAVDGDVAREAPPSRSTTLTVPTS